MSEHRKRNLLYVTGTFSAGTVQCLAKRLAAASLRLSLCIPWRRVEGGEGIAAPIINVGSRWTWESASRPSRFPIGKSARYLLGGGGWGVLGCWASEMVCKFWRRDGALAFAGIRIPDHPNVLYQEKVTLCVMTVSVQQFWSCWGQVFDSAGFAPWRQSFGVHVPGCVIPGPPSDW